MRQVTHPEFQNTYAAGFNAKQAEINAMGFAASRDKFNMDNPVGQKHSSMAAYYYAEGEIDALVAAQR
jgi:hypothetical protein